MAVVPALLAGTAVFSSEAQANPDDSLAFGNGAQASGTSAVAVGYMASATDVAALAVGTRAVADSPDSTAVGTDAAALSANATVLGSGASTADHSPNAMAIGHNAAAAAPNTLAIGTSSTATGDSSVAFGYGAYTSSGASGSMALGANAVVNAPDSVALGANTWVNAPGVVAIGANTSVSALGSVALGANTSASAAGSVALGNGSLADRVNAVSIGTGSQQRQIVNVAAGTQNTDAVNVSQLKGVATAIGGGAAVNPDGTLQQPAFTVNGRTYATISAALAAASSTSDGTVRYDSVLHKMVTLGGAGATTPVLLTNVAAGAKNTDAVNAGQLKRLGASLDTGGNVLNSFAAYDSAAQDSITLKGAAGTTITGLAAGSLAAGSTDAVNGTQLYATNQNVAENTGNITQNTNDIARNTSNITNLDTRVTTVEGSVTSLTSQINTGTVGLVQQDPTSRNLGVAKDTDGTQVDFTGTAGARELRGVAAGTSNGSAVNVGQLKPVVSALGGGAQINADGSVTGPTYRVQGGTQTTVGDALGSLDNGLTTLQQDIAAGNIGLVTQDATSRIINVGGATNGTLINLAGTAGNRVVTGVAPGVLNAASTDAVNGSQLYAHAVSTAVALGGGSTVNADGTITAPSYSVGGTSVNSVGGAIGNLDGRVTQNTSAIASLQTTVGSISGTVANALQYDSSTHNSVTLGGSAGAPPVQLTNLQAGTLSATSTDAVTGAQLWTTNRQVSDLTQAVQNVQTNGNTGIATNTTGTPAAATGPNSTAIGGGATASGANSVALGQGSVADQPNTVSVGSPGNERRLTNVANGVAPTDAVNMGQFQSGMSDMARNAYSGTASAIALTMIPEVDATRNLAIGVGTSGYKGYQAMAVGLSARVTQNLKVKLGAGISSATTTVGAGAAYQW